LEEDLNRITKLIAERGTDMVMEALASLPNDAEGFSDVDYATPGHRCRELHLHGISGCECREDPEASPHHFCHYLCLGLSLARTRLPLDGAQERLPDRDNRIAGHWITVLMSCFRRRNRSNFGSRGGSVSPSRYWTRSQGATQCHACLPLRSSPSSLAEQ
jgi:hypothetical protein